MTESELQNELAKICEQLSALQDEGIKGTTVVLYVSDNEESTSAEIKVISADTKTPLSLLLKTANILTEQ